MSRHGWMSRVRAWFGANHDAPRAAEPQTSWAAAGGGQLALVGAAIAEDRAPAGETTAPAPTRPEQPGPALAPATPEAERPSSTDRQAPPRPPIDPIDPPWAEHLDSLDGLGRELKNHRDTNQALLQTVRQLPELTSDQTDHIVRTNQLLERQNTLLGSILDTLAGLRASMQTMEESSRRHLTAIGGLEASHREVLWAYQKMLQKSHRRLGRLALLATLLAALALGGGAYVAYLVLVGG